MRDPQASEPFTVPELDRVLEACETTELDWLPGASKFLAYTGAHISVLSGGWRRELVRPAGGTPFYEFVYSRPIRSDAIRGDLIYWRRPKNQKQIGMPISRHIRDWVADYLDQERPLSRGRYNVVLNRVGRESHMKINPLRFRHTCACLLFHVMGLSAADIEIYLGISSDTVSTYILRPKWMVAQELRQKGW